MYKFILLIGIYGYWVSAAIALIAILLYLVTTWWVATSVIVVSLIPLALRFLVGSINIQ